MKIIRLTTFLDFGGQEKQYISLTEDTNLLNHEYVFGAIGYGGYAEKIITDRGFKVKIFNQNPRFTNLKNIWILYKWFKKERPDIVHTAASEANFHGVIAAKFAGVNVVIAEEIGLPKHSFRAKLLFKFIYRKLDGVICVSKSVKEWLIKLGEIKKDKGIVVYNPVSVPQIISKSTSNKFQMVYVGRLEQNKNVAFLLEALNILNSIKPWELTIVGDGSQRSKLESIALKLGIYEKVYFKGFSNKPERYVSQSDLFILPSISEGFGIAAVEAMFQGIPCLCSNVGGIPEFITNNETGWLFNPNNLNSLLTELKRIMEMNEEQRILIGQSGRAEVQSRFTTKIHIENIEKVYSQLKE